MTIRIGIAGFGNLGRGAALAVANNPDMTLAGIFTRRDPASIDVPASIGSRAGKDATAGANDAPAAAPVFAWDELAAHHDRIDVLLLCGGSKDDLPIQSPQLAADFNIVDSFDTHAKIPEHFAAVDTAARTGGHVALISTGWDPGLFSLQRVFGESLLPDGATYTFWGRGVSQGHSEALRRVPGVAAAVQYTIPAEAAIDAARSGSRPDLATRDKHTRECFVVLAAGADPASVREEIATMPNYFADYDTSVHFVSADELTRDHDGMPHGGFVLRSGSTTAGNNQLIEYRLALDSNPQFTASVLVAYARAVARMAADGVTGAHTVFDIAPGLLSPRTPAELRADLL